VGGQHEIALMGETMNYMAQELELLDDTRRKFISDVSHELKTPMTGIKLICDTLEDGNDPELQKELIGDISTEVDRLSRLVDKLLTLSRLDDKKIQLEQVDIKPMISKIKRNLLPVAKKKEINIYDEYKFETYPHIAADYDKLYEAFYNIADNAIKYSPEGGYLHIDVDCDTQNIVVSFEDNGPGVPEEERERVFERFYRLDDSRARDTGGTGLGLAIAKEAVNMHGGNITVSTPESGKGSIFKVTIPVRAGEEAQQ
jgi:signal transduction histidine kinase